MMYEAQDYLGTAWWMMIGPMVLLAATGLSLSVLADGLLAKGSSDGR
jgi:ABC-type dipeptide/oligopeptide/nickel transport system permease subunit